MGDDWADDVPVEMEAEQAVAVLADHPEVKLFGKWSCEDVAVSDMCLQDYIAVKERHAKFLPHSSGRYAAKRFRKASCPIVERLVNSLMMHGRLVGSSVVFCWICTVLSDV